MIRWLNGYIMRRLAVWSSVTANPGPHLVPTNGQRYGVGAVRQLNLPNPPGDLAIQPQNGQNAPGKSWKAPGSNIIFQYHSRAFTWTPELANPKP